MKLRSSGLLFHGLLTDHAATRPQATALEQGERHLSYAQAADEARAWAQSLQRMGVRRFDRVGIYLPMQIEAVTTLFGASLAGAVFVPIIPLLRPAQVQAIVRDSGCTLLITTAARLAALREHTADWLPLRQVIVVGEPAGADTTGAGFEVLHWQAEPVAPDFTPTRVIDADVAALLYTSGSTGRSKGVVLSHRNLVCAAHSLVELFDNQPEDRLLVILAMGFDYGLSQVTSAFACGGCAVLLEYLGAADIVRAVEQRRITGLATVPSVWSALAAQPWPDGALRMLRFAASSGAALPAATLASLRARLPHTGFHLMYGLTEAFCSTCLLPQDIDTHPGTVGLALPQAEIAVVRDDGTSCATGERGELVHRGGLVALGYWGDPALSARRFRPWPLSASELPLPDMAVWSGDEVSMDSDGFLTFHGRRDELVKVGGMSVHPLEIEQALQRISGLDEWVAVPVPHGVLGTVFVALATAGTNGRPDLAALLRRCQRDLPSAWVPRALHLCDALPHTASGKLDRHRIAAEVRVGRLPGLDATAQGGTA